MTCDVVRFYRGTQEEWYNAELMRNVGSLNYLPGEFGNLVPTLGQELRVWVGFRVDMAHACLVVWNREDASKDKHPHEHFPKHPLLRLHSQPPQPFTSKGLRKVYE